MAGVRRRPAAEVLRADGEGQDPARRVERLLEAPQRNDLAAWTIAMQKVININLNGNAYQLEDAAYVALQEYLARAERELKDNPDRAEIVADLEQAIADKCQKYLGPHKSVVTSAEVTQIIAEMGPVTAGSAAASGEQSGAAGEKREEGAGAAPPPKRLYRIPDGA